MNFLPIIQVVAVLLVAPGVVGLVRFVKARLQGRVGASPLLPYTALASLMQKEMTITVQSSWVFHAVPFVVFALAGALAFLVPTLGPSTLLLNNIFVVSALTALSSVFLVFGGMDTGSTFGNMGSSREMTLAALVEPALVTSLATLALIAGVWHLDGIVSAFTVAPWYSAAPYAAITFVALLFVVLSENARYPVDNPATHLELTMVHEAMLLEYSGPYLALLEYAGAVKLTVLGLFLVNVMLPVGLLGTNGLALWAFPLFVVKAALVAVCIAAIETVIVKMRFYRMQEYMMTAFIISLAGLVAAIISFHI